MKSVDKSTVDAETDPLGFGSSSSSASRRKPGAFMAKAPASDLSSPDLSSRQLKVSKNITKSEHNNDQDNIFRGLGTTQSTKSIFSSSASLSTTTAAASGDPLAFLKGAVEKDTSSTLFDDDPPVASASVASVLTKTEGEAVKVPVRIGTKEADGNDEDIHGLMVGQILRKEEATDEDRALFGSSAARKNKAEAIQTLDQVVSVTSKEEASLAAIDEALQEVKAVEAASIPAPTKVNVSAPSLTAAVASVPDVDIDTFDMDKYIEDNDVDSGDLF